MKERIEILLKACDQWFNEYFNEVFAADCYYLDQMYNEWRRAQQGKCTWEYAVENIMNLYNKLSGQTPLMKEAYNSVLMLGVKEKLHKTVTTSEQLSLF